MAACVVPSYILHHVFSYLDLHYQLRTLARVCRSWHHAALCMNCITTNITVQDAKRWFSQYFDTEIVDSLMGDFKSIIGAPYSYVVRNLALHVLRDIQEAVPNIEIEIFMLYSQLAKAHNRSEKLLKVYQVSALLYLLRKLESTFNIYDIFNDVELALSNIQIPICRRDCLKMLVHVGSMLKYRFDQNSPHINDTGFHVQAAIKCFDVKLLIKKSPPWIPIFELLEATIGPKFLRPDTVFQNFEKKLVEICKNDFADFNELLSFMESDLVIHSEEGSHTEPSETKMPRTGITKFPAVSNEFLAQYIALQPSEYCEKNHALRMDSPSSDALVQEDEDPGDPHNTSTYSARSSQGSYTPSRYDSTPNKNNISNNNNSPRSNNNTPNSIRNMTNDDSSNITNDSLNSTKTHNSDNPSTPPTNDDDMDVDDYDDAFISHETYTHKNDLDSNYFDSSGDESKNGSDGGKSASKKSPRYSNEQPNANAGSIATNPKHEPTAINHAEKKTNNDESFASPDMEAEHPTRNRPVEDYKYFFASEENSFEDEDEEFVDAGAYADDEELVDADDVDYDDQFEDDEKENEPPAKFVKIATNTPDKCNVH
eukprot:Phypoly_transcript_04845.p1 GENE.Phypoly_transcript_04845~~Phypoly_transcript_04845.p1  ORF type:complete len:597 (+),score=116.63 Phypoly_transcript_04845:110-1900(+)